MSNHPPAAFTAVMAVLSHVYFAPLVGRLLEARVPDLLDEGAATAAHLAHRTGLHALSLERALRALAAFGVFREEAPHTFANNEASNLLRSCPGGLRNWALFATSDQFLGAANALGRSLETGRPAHDHAFGQDVWEYLRDHPENGAAFHQGLAEIRNEDHLGVARAYDWSGVNSVVDIGGGTGSLLSAILEANPHMRGTLLEQPQVLPDADRLLRSRGVRDRCTLLGGSFLEPIAATGDVWVLSQVLHDWPDSECVAILQRCREQMAVTDRLLVVEMLPVPGRPDIEISLIDIAMMMFAGEARQRTADEYNTLFGAAGFAPAHVLPTRSRFSIVETHPLA